LLRSVLKTFALVLCGQPAKLAATVRPLHHSDRGMQVGFISPHYFCDR